MVRRNDSQSKKDEEVKTMDKMFELINSLNALTKAVTALTEKITSEYLNTRPSTIQKRTSHRKSLQRNSRHLNSRLLLL